MSDIETYFQKGKEALTFRIKEMDTTTRFQIKSIRDHFETGHGGKHTIPNVNTPLLVFYKLLGDQIMDLQVLRMVDPPKFARSEIMSWLMSSLIFQVIPHDIKWSDFEKQLMQGLEKFTKKQLDELDNPINKAMIVNAGMSVATAEQATGKSFKEQLQ